MRIGHFAWPSLVSLVHLHFFVPALMEESQILLGKYEMCVDFSSRAVLKDCRGDIAEALGQGKTQLCAEFWKVLLRPRYDVSSQLQKGVHQIDGTGLQDSVEE